MPSPRNISGGSMVSLGGARAPAPRGRPRFGGDRLLYRGRAPPKHPRTVPTTLAESGPPKPYQMSTNRRDKRTRVTTTGIIDEATDRSQRGNHRPAKRSNCYRLG